MTTAPAERQSPWFDAGFTLERQAEDDFCGFAGQVDGLALYTYSELPDDREVLIMSGEEQPAVEDVPLPGFEMDEQPAGRHALREAPEDRAGNDPTEVQ